MQFESHPHDSHHKYELPVENLLPPKTSTADEHLAQISQQLFALCYNVESFIHMAKEYKFGGFDSAVWYFFHEVINFLPRSLDPKEIDEACIDLYQALYRAERSKPIAVTELVNPGAPIPEPLAKEAEDDASTPIEIEAVHDGNPYSKKLFSLTQNALVATDGVEYALEFIPDMVQGVGVGVGVSDIETQSEGEDEDEEPEWHGINQEDLAQRNPKRTPPMSMLKGKLVAKGKLARKGKGVIALARKKAAASPAKARAAKTAAKSPVRRLVKARGARSPSHPSHSGSPPSILTLSSPEPDRHSTPARKKVSFRLPDPGPDTKERTRPREDMTTRIWYPPAPLPGCKGYKYTLADFKLDLSVPPPPTAPIHIYGDPLPPASVGEAGGSHGLAPAPPAPHPASPAGSSELSSPPSSPSPATVPTRRKRGRPADDGVAAPPAPKKARTISKKKKVVVPPVEGTRKSLRNKK
ncbi:hypothetical protein FB451DRAFT_1251503 [Mycena latifolia]|nr:hypothetical protein FB451DRAFT_1251503 [Mycena latifolia]